LMGFGQMLVEPADGRLASAPQLCPGLNQSDLRQLCEQVGWAVLQ